MDTVNDDGQSRCLFASSWKRSRSNQTIASVAKRRRSNRSNGSDLQPASRPLINFWAACSTCLSDARRTSHKRLDLLTNGRVLSAGSGVKGSLDGNAPGSLLLSHQADHLRISRAKGKDCAERVDGELNEAQASETRLGAAPRFGSYITQIVSYLSAESADRSQSQVNCVQCTSWSPRPSPSRVSARVFAYRGAMASEPRLCVRCSAQSAG